MRTAAALLASSVLLTGCVMATEVGPETAQPPRSGVPTAASDSAPADRSYSFLHVRKSGEPVRWSSCEPIRYVVRPDHRPPGAQQLLTDSIAAISEITDLELVDQGSTQEAPSQKRPLYQPDRYGDQWAPVLIAFSTPDEYEPLRGRPAGHGGAAYVESSNAEPRYVSGSVVFDAPQLERIGERRARAVMLHELAHVVGLGHVQDRGQLMNPVQYAGRTTTFQDGDIAGLTALGDTTCLEPLDPSGLGPLTSGG